MSAEVALCNKERIIPGVVFIIIKNGQVLLEKRPVSSKDKFSGLIVLPGGHFEPKETAPYAVVREIREETGVSKPICSLLGIFPFSYNGVIWDSHVFVVTDLGGKKPINKECRKGRHLWKSWEEAIETVSLDASREMIRRAERFIFQSPEEPKGD